MKQKIVLVLTLFAFAAVAAFGQAPTKIGTNKCKLCHKVEFTSWSTTKHATGKVKVECEDCHGPGSKYSTMAIMKDKAKSKANGLIEPTEADCKTCHAKNDVKVANYAEAMKKVHDKKQKS